MSISLNGHTMGSLYLGSASLKEAYFGSHKVFSKGPTLHDHMEIELLADAAFTYINSRNRPSKFTIDGVVTQPYSISSYRYYNTSYTGALFVDLPSGTKIGVWGLDGWVSGDCPSAISSGANTSADRYLYDFKINFFDSNLTKAKSMFTSGQNCLLAIPDSWADLIHLTSARGMFAQCRKLVNGGISDFSALSSLTDCYQMFTYCSNWVGDAYSLYQYLSPRITTYNNYGGCFYSCTKAIGWSNIPGGWR